MSFNMNINFYLIGYKNRMATQLSAMFRKVYAVHTI